MKFRFDGIYYFCEIRFLSQRAVIGEVHSKDFPFFLNLNICNTSILNGDHTRIPLFYQNLW